MSKYLKVDQCKIKCLKMGDLLYVQCKIKWAKTPKKFYINK